MLARHRRKILVASATAALVAGAFVAVSANSESPHTPALVQSAALPESTSAQATGALGQATETSMVPTAAVAEPRRSARKTDSQRRVVQNVGSPHIPLILGVRH
jgi:hypothetical protein